MDKIEINKYLYFDKESGRFALTSEASEIVYREKNVICSYSGADEWCNHFVCELIDLYSGSSKYNYSLGTTVHEARIPQLWQDDRDGVCAWIEDAMEKEWGKHAFSMFLSIIDDLVPIE